MASKSLEHFWILVALLGRDNSVEWHLTPWRGSAVGCTQHQKLIKSGLPCKALKPPTTEWPWSAMWEAHPKSGSLSITAHLTEYLLKFRDLDAKNKDMSLHTRMRGPRACLLTGRKARVRAYRWDLMVALFVFSEDVVEFVYIRGLLDHCPAPPRGLCKD